MGNVPLAIPFSETGVEEIERAQMLARRYHAEFVDLKNFKIQHELFKRVPVDMMFRYNFVPLEQVDDRLAIAVSDPSKLMVLDEISGLLGQRLVTRVATLTPDHRAAEEDGAVAARAGRGERGAGVRRSARATITRTRTSRSSG